MKKEELLEALKEVNEATVKAAVKEAVVAIQKPELFAEAFKLALKEVEKPAAAKLLEAEYGEPALMRGKACGEFYLAALEAQYGIAPFSEAIKGKAISPDVAQKGDPTKGGVTVPTIVAAEISLIEKQMSVIMAKANIFPQKQTVTLPVRASGVSVSHPNEGGRAPLSLPRWTTRTFELSKGVCIIPATEDLLRASIIQLSNYFNMSFAEAFAEDIDFYGFRDNAAPYVGILYAAGKSVYLGNDGAGNPLDLTTVYDNLLKNKIIEVVSKLPSTQHAGAEFYFSQTVEARIAQMEDTQGRPLWLAGAFGRPSTIYNRPYTVADRMPALDELTGTGKACLFYGNLAKYRVGQDGDMQLAVSTDATLVDSENNIVSGFQDGVTFFKATAWRSGNVAHPDAFVKMETGPDPG